MHKGNRRWLQNLKDVLPTFFDGASVLEIGSYNVNGTARDYFQKARRYVGVDRVAGPGVDVVADARETDFKGHDLFDTLVCLSVFEHDPGWAELFRHNLQWLRLGGLIIAGWGAEGNLRHDPEPWAIVPAGAFIAASQAWPIRIIDGFFEEDRFGPDTPGAFNLLAVRI